ncbi:hypothetical protein DFQ26_004374, partial [Actinomortierella ambigua]
MRQPQDVAVTIDRGIVVDQEVRLTTGTIRGLGNAVHEKVTVYPHVLRLACGSDGNITASVSHKNTFQPFCFMHHTEEDRSLLEGPLAIDIQDELALISYSADPTFEGCMGLFKTKGA